jgi:hypothetical protein
MIIKHLCSRCSEFAEIRIRAICFQPNDKVLVRDEFQTNAQPWDYLCRKHFDMSRGGFSMDIEDLDFNERLR